MASDASGSSAPPPAVREASTINDIAGASKWLQDHASSECKDREHLVKVCELLQRPPQRGDKEEWAKTLASWKTAGIRYKYKNEQDHPMSCEVSMGGGTPPIFGHRAGPRELKPA